MSRFHVSKEVTMLADPSNHRTGLAPACFDTKIFDFGWWPSVRHPDPSRMRQRMQSQAFVTDTSPSREYQVDFWRSRATYFAEAADQSFVQWKAEKKLNDGKVRHLEDELAGIKKSMESYDITIIALHEKDQKNQGYIESLQNQLKEASLRHGSTAHGPAPLTPPAAPEALYPRKHSGDTPSQSQYSMDDSQRVSPVSSPISTSPSSVSSFSLSQPGSESTGTQANLLKSQKRLLTLSSQIFLPSQHKRVHIRRLRQPQPCLRFRTTPLHVPDGVFKLDDCVRLGMWHSGNLKTEVKVREDRGGYCLVVVSIRDRGKKDVVGLGVEVCRGGLSCLGLLPA
ncbi:uncharacterized protein QC763_507755 [Podospora pseudopauciseta]|uniref:Uncharacterized protein n=1 Tax=Podospora pseudopauciseta TaxID=2093780 RepID=A0ABR0H9U4_9PEZI|nr:hypothetical protein QC763_507755 [Podospora pseudopauciseta]